MRKIMGYIETETPKKVKNEPALILTNFKHEIIKQNQEMDPDHLNMGLK